MLYTLCLVVLGGELAVPFSRNPLYAGLNSLLRVIALEKYSHFLPAAMQQTVMNLVRSGRKQR